MNNNIKNKAENIKSWPLFKRIGLAAEGENKYIKGDVDFLCNNIENWIEATAEYQRHLTVFVSKKSPKRYQEWNNSVIEIKKIISPIIDHKINRLEFPKNILMNLRNSIKWDCLHGFMEISYKDLNPPLFFEDVLTIYQLGHIPCGIDLSSKKIVVL